MLQISVEFDVKSKNSSMFLIINLAPIIERKPIKAKKLNHEKRSQKTRVFEKKSPACKNWPVTAKNRLGNYVKYQRE